MMPQVRADALDAIVFDFDGVLTDNRVIVFDDGREAVVCNRSNEQPSQDESRAPRNF